MRQIKIDSLQILALTATFRQANLSFFRFPSAAPEQFIAYFKEREDERNCLHAFIRRCQEEKIPIQFHDFPTLNFFQLVYYRLFQKQALSEFELATAGYFCQEMLQVLENPSADAIRQTKFLLNCNPFLENVLFPHLTVRQIQNAHRIGHFFHTFHYTFFSLKEILAARERLVSMYIEHPDYPS